MNDLRSVDLNLLVILDALLNEAHVTRAAAQLGLSQPATSSALDRLRRLFGDPLLERGPNGMCLTPKAEALRLPLKDTLGSIRTMLRMPPPDLATACQTVRLAMADALAATSVAALHRRLMTSAPGVTVMVLPWHGAADGVKQLARGDVDLVASMLPPLGPDYHQVPLLREHYLVVMRHDHPAAAGFGLQQWLAYPHAVVSGHADAATPLDVALSARGLSRRIGVVVPSFLLVPPLLMRSDLIAMLPSRAVPDNTAGSLAVFQPPVAVDGFCLDLAWHQRRHEDPVVRHVAGTLIEALQPPCPTGPNRCIPLPGGSEP